MPSLVYIAGPYTSPDPVTNVRDAVFAAETVRALGGVPFVPHLFHLWHTISPHDYDFWMALDFDMLARCDVVWRIPGESPGADREVAEAAKRGISVVIDVRSLADVIS